MSNVDVRRSRINLRHGLILLAFLAQAGVAEPCGRFFGSVDHAERVASARKKIRQAPDGPELARLEEEMDRIRFKPGAKLLRRWEALRGSLRKARARRGFEGRWKDLVAIRAKASRSLPDGYFVAEERVREKAGDRDDLSLEMLREINRMVRSGPNGRLSYGTKVHARLDGEGDWRPWDIYIGGRAALRAEDVAMAMARLMDWYDEAKTRLHPIDLAAQMSMRLISIHPFADGNGRTARLVSDFILMRNGYLPPIYDPKRGPPEDAVLPGWLRPDGGKLLEEMTGAIENCARLAIDG